MSEQEAGLLAMQQILTKSIATNRLQRKLDVISYTISIFN